MLARSARSGGSRKKAQSGEGRAPKQIYRQLNRRFVIVASGPSLTREDVEFCRDLADDVLVINNNYQLAPWADHLYACDADWWEYHGDDVKTKFKGRTWTQCKASAKKWGATHIPGEHGLGLHWKPGYIRFGGNSGHQAIGLAVHLGASEIVLLGYDMKTDRGLHWHGAHPAGLNNPHHCSQWLPAFDAMAEDLRKINVKCVNATRDTAITAFPRVKLREYLLSKSAPRIVLRHERANERGKTSRAEH